MLVEFQWVQGFLGQSPLADMAGQGGTHDGCRSAVDIWVVPSEDTAVAVCTGGSPHDPAGRVSNGLNKEDQALELMEEVAQSETWFEDSKLLAGRVLAQTVGQLLYDLDKRYLPAECYTTEIHEVPFATVL